MKSCNTLSPKAHQLKSVSALLAFYRTETEARAAYVTLQEELPKFVRGLEFRFTGPGVSGLEV